MEIIVIGAGQAGTHIAHMLSIEDHKVTVIDPNPLRIEEIESELDVLTLCEHGANPQVLEKAGVRGADLVAAVTQSDEVNLIVALTAKELGAKKTAARVYDPTYLEGTKVSYHNILGIDMIIAPHILTAFEIAKHIDHPAALAMESFAQGRVLMRQITVPEDSSVIGKTVKEVFPPSVPAVLASLTRDAKIHIPGADDQFMKGDVVTVVAPPKGMKKVRYSFKDTEMRAHSILIGGGGSTAFHLAQLLESRSFEVRLVERDPQRCEVLSRELENTTILHGDVTQVKFLKEERVESVDVFVALCGDDQTNLISALLAHELGTQSTTAVCNRSDFLPITKKLGVDFAVSPRILTANKMLTLAGQGHLASVAALDNGAAEVLEFVVVSDCKIAGKTLGKDMRMPKNSVLGAIVRGKEVMVPRGGAQILPGDRVIAFALQGVVHEVSELFD